MKQVTAALITNGDRILITHRSLIDKMAGKWEFPGGKIEPGETPEACLAREIVEKLGVTIDVGDFFADSIYTYEFGSIQLLSYWATIQKGQVTFSAQRFSVGFFFRIKQL
jgi:8-oxo-dGTP diphosphatase